MLEPIPNSRPTAPRARRPGLLLGICLVLFATKVFWTDLRIIDHQISGDPFRMMLAVHTAVLCPFIAYALWRGRGLIMQHRVAWSFAVVALVGCIGVVQQDSVRWMSVVQDIVRLSFVPAAVALTVIDKPCRLDRFLDRLALAVLAMIVAKVGLFLWVGSDTGYLYYGSIYDVFPFCVFAARYCDPSRENFSRYAALAAVSLLIVVIGLKRANFGVLAVASAYLLVRHRTDVLAVPLRFVTGVLAVGFAIGCSGELAQAVDQRLTRETAHAETKGRAIEVRLHELGAVGRKIADGGLIQKLLGFGHGATFRGLPSYDTGETVKHTVHFTPAALVFRYGGVGVAFLLILIAGVLLPDPVSPAPCDSTSTFAWMNADDAVALKTFAVGSLASSAFEFGFVDDMLVGFAFGALIVASRQVTVRHASRDSSHCENEETVAPLAA